MARGLHEHPDGGYAGYRRRRRMRTLTSGVAVVAVAVFGFVIWQAYHLGVREGTETVAPLIRAESTPHKIRPDNPGGIQVPNQDTNIYETIAPGQKQQSVERLLPPAEEPMERPAAEEPAPVPAPPGSAGDEPAPPEPPGIASLIEDLPGQGQPPPAQPGVEAEAPAAPAAEAPPPVPAPQQAAPPPASAASAPPSGWRIQIGAFRTEDEVRQVWQRRQAGHPELLGNLQLMMERADLGAKGIYYRLRAGPLPDRGAAQAICAGLKERKIDCLVVAP